MRPINGCGSNSDMAHREYLIWKILNAGQSAEYPLPARLPKPNASPQRTSIKIGNQLNAKTRPAIDTVQLFANPTAGRAARRRVAALRCSFVARGIRVLDGEYGSEALQIDQRAQHVCCAGGDGTLRHVLTAILETDREITVSVYPNGTVNLVARECGYPNDPVAFVDRVLLGVCRLNHYIGLVGEVPMASCASIGPDSYAVSTVSPLLKRAIGRAAYFVAVCSYIIRWRREKVTLLGPELQMACEAVSIAKGRFFAGPWSLSPDASAHSPKFEVIAFRDASRTTYCRLWWSLLRGLPIGALPGAEAFTCTELVITSEQPVPLQSDGDIVGDLPLRISLRVAPIEFA
ncbi:diacylglycerol/lipid kinase family protein [Sphingomonas sp. UYP23]